MVFPKVERGFAVAIGRWLGSIETLKSDESDVDAGAVDTLMKMRPKLARLNEFRVYRTTEKALSAPALTERNLPAGTVRSPYSFRPQRAVGPA